MQATTGIQVHRSKALSQAELAIAYVLRAGVALSGSVIAFGLILREFHLSPVHLSSRKIVGIFLSGKMLEPGQVARSISDFVAGVKSLDPDVVVAIGILLLIGLPIVRVAMTVVLFLVERDYAYLGITLLVLAVLMSGIFLGRSL